MKSDDLMKALSSGADFSQFSRDDLAEGLNQLTAQITGGRLQQRGRSVQVMGIVTGQAEGPIITCPNPLCQQRIELDLSDLP